MTELQINFITLHPATHRSHRAITHVGMCFIPDGPPMWHLPVTTVIELIESNAERYFLIDLISCRRREIEVMRTEAGVCHLQARLNRRWTNDLLSLPSLTFATAPRSMCAAMQPPFPGQAGDGAR